MSFKLKKYLHIYSYYNLKTKKIITYTYFMHAQGKHGVWRKKRLLFWDAQIKLHMMKRKKKDKSNWIKNMMILIWKDTNCKVALYNKFFLTKPKYNFALGLVLLSNWLIEWFTTFSVAWNPNETLFKAVGTTVQDFYFHINKTNKRKLQT